MSDRWEGSFGQLNVELRPQIWGAHYQDRLRLAPMTRAWMMQSTHINCWHLSEIESAAMWDIYQREGRGVAIRSTWGQLKRCITSDRWVNGAKIKYVDYTSSFIPEANSFDPFMHKRESFSHEREVRLAMLTGLTGPHPDQEGTSINLGPEPPVLAVDVDVPTLIGGVYVAPDAPQWILDVVSNVTKQYGYSFSVRQSDLASDPIA